MNNYNILRVLSALLFLVMPPFYAYAIIQIIDIFDCAPSITAWKNKLRCHLRETKNLNFRKCSIPCSIYNENYNNGDKVIDLYLAFVSLLFIYKSKYFYLLTVLFLIRTMGVMMYFKTKNSKYLIYFPDLYSWFYLYLIGSETFNYKIKSYVVVLLTVAKYWQEIYFHNNNNISKAY